MLSSASYPGGGGGVERFIILKESRTAAPWIIDCFRNRQDLIKQLNGPN